MTVSSSIGRRKLFAQINSFIAVFILAGQLTLTVCYVQLNICSILMLLSGNYRRESEKYFVTFICHVQGRILTVAGVTTAICSSPIVAFSNLVAIAVWPTWLAVAISETLRKVGLIY